MVIVLPDAVQSPVAVNATASPELLVALTEKGASPYVLPGSAAKVIDWAALLTTSFCVLSLACLKFALAGRSSATSYPPGFAGRVAVLTVVEKFPDASTDALPVTAPPVPLTVMPTEPGAGRGPAFTVPDIAAVAA